MADLLTQAMALADSYARRRAFFASHPFTREKDEQDAERALDEARTALSAFLAEHLAGVALPAAVTDEMVEVGIRAFSTYGKFTSRERLRMALNAALGVALDAPPSKEVDRG